MDAKYINKNYLENSIKDYDTTIVSPIRNVVSNIYYNTADEFNSINNTFNDVNALSNDRYNDLIKVIDISTPGGIGLDLQLNYINSTSPVNYQGARNIKSEIGQIGNLWCATPDKAGTQYFEYKGSTLTFSSLTGTVTANANMDDMFNHCYYAKFVGDIIIPNNATTMNSTFHSCYHFNKNILIPNSVTDMNYTFAYCQNLNQNILIPNSVIGLAWTFSGCYNLNQNILIPNSVTNMWGIFNGCKNLNQNILIPNSVTRIHGAFKNCTSLNQNILIPNSVTGIESMFQNCTSLNQNILIPNSVTYMSNIDFVEGTFMGCTSLNQPIAIPNSVRYMMKAFKGCTSLNQDDMYIYSQNIVGMDNAYNGVQHIGNIHIPTSVPKSTSNLIYNCLVNGNTGYTFAPENIINDLPVDIAQWPPV